MKTKIDIITALVGLSLMLYAFKFLVKDFSEYWLPPKLKVKYFSLALIDLTWNLFHLGLITSLATITWFLLEIRRRRYSDMVNAVLEVGDSTNELYDRVSEDKPSIKECFELLDASAEVYEDLMLLQEAMKINSGHNLSGRIYEN